MKERIFNFKARKTKIINFLIDGIQKNNKKQKLLITKNSKINYKKPFYLKICPFF